MEFYENIEDLLKNNELDKIYELFKLESNIESINASSWDLATLFCNYLNKQEDENSNLIPVDVCVRQLSLVLCEKFGNAKELFLVYLENSENFLNKDTDFTFLICLMKNIFTRLESTNFASKSLELALNELMKYIKKTSTHNNQPGFYKLVEELVDFVENFVKLESTDSDYNLNILLTQNLINLFDQPFSNCIMLATNEENNDHESLPALKKCYSLISILNKDLFKLIVKLENDLAKQTNKVDDDLNEKGYEVTEMALHSFYYFTLVATARGLNTKLCNIPLIYTQFYMLKTLLPISIRILTNYTENQDYLVMGLYTIDHFINKIDVKTLDPNILSEIEIVRESLEVLFRLVVYSTFETIRAKALRILEKYIKCLNRQARFEFIRDFLNAYQSDETLNNYLGAYLIYLFKEELNECFAQNDSFYFVQENEKNFKCLFDLIFQLKQNENTDILKETSRITASLNMLRFILIRDKNNFTNVHELIKSNKYLNYLADAIHFSKVRCELECKNLKSSTNFQQDSKPLFEVKTNLNESIQEPSNQERIKSLEKALQNIDLIECLRVRINELIQGCK